MAGIVRTIYIEHVSARGIVDGNMYGTCFWSTYCTRQFIRRIEHVFGQHIVHGNYIEHVFGAIDFERAVWYCLNNVLRYCTDKTY